MNNFFNCDYKKHVFNIYILSQPVVGHDESTAYCTPPFQTKLTALLNYYSFNWWSILSILNTVSFDREPYIY